MVAVRGEHMAHAWIQLSKPGMEMLRFFCFPYSGGTAQVFRPFVGLLPGGSGVYAFELPGRGRRFTDPPLDSVSAMVKEALSGMVSLLGSVDCCFFGHSLGGILAFELARELRRQGLPMPKHLYVSGIRAPQVPRREDNAYDLPHDAFLGKLREMGGTPHEILENQEMLELVLPVLRKDFQAYETYTYTPEPPLACPITAFGGSRDTFVTADDIQQWSVQTKSLFARKMFDGDHFFIHEHFTPIADTISKSLARMRPW